jgi:hypothetical protein
MLPSSDLNQKGFSMTKITLIKKNLYALSALLMCCTLTCALAAKKDNLTLTIEPNVLHANQQFLLIIAIRSDRIITTTPVIQSFPEGITLTGISHHFSEVRDDTLLNLRQTWILRLHAHKKGHFVIPPIRIGSHTTAPIRLMIQPALPSTDGQQEKPLNGTQSQVIKPYEEITPDAESRPVAHSPLKKHNVIYIQLHEALFSLLSFKWIIYPALFILGMILLGQLATRRERESIIHRPNPSQKRHYLEENIYKACQRNNAHDCSRAFKAWAHTQWPNAKTYDLKHIATLIRHPEFKLAIKNLEKCLNDSSTIAFNGSTFWQVFCSAKSRYGKKPNRTHT